MAEIVITIRDEGDRASVEVKGDLVMIEAPTPAQLFALMVLLEGHREKLIDVKR